MNRQQINKAADDWMQADPDKRAVLCLISEKKNGEDRGSCSIGGNTPLLLDSIVNAMMKSPVLVNILRHATTQYNDTKIHMN